MNDPLPRPDTLPCAGGSNTDAALPSSELGSVERFSLVAEIGVGGLGCIYKAWDEVLGKYVALKMVSFADPALEARLRHEAAVAQSLTHPCIVRIHDIVTAHGKTCISMEYVEGPNLAEYLSEQGPVEAATVSGWAQQIGAGLAAAHAAGIVHCDLKPSNLMLDGDRVRIVDFGLAIQTASPHGPGGGDGTPAYMSPEQKQQLPVDCRTDFYSLGLILFELLSGRRATAAELEQVSVDQWPPALRQIPGRLRKVVARCLQCRPERRYANARELLSDLTRSRPTLPRPGQPGITARPLGLRLAWVAPALLCLLAAFHWSPSLAVSAYPPTRSSSKRTTVALLPLQSTASLEPVADGLDDYLRAAFQQFAGVQVWTPAGTSRPSQQTLSAADLIVTGQVSAMGDYLTVRLSVEPGRKRGALFSLVISAKTVFELEDRLWDRVTAEPHWSHLTAHAAKPLLYCQRRTETNFLYLRANSLVRWHRRTEDLREAVTLLNQALAEDPRCALCYARKAAAELRLCDINQDGRWLKDVLADVQQAQDINDSAEQIILPAAQAYAHAGRRKEAILLLRRAQKSRAGSAEISRVLGGILADEGLYAEALAELRQAVRWNPLDGRSLNTLGATELLVPDYTAAIQAFSQLLAVDPDSPYARTNLAGAYLRAGRFPEAVHLLETVLQTQPVAANYSNLGMALFFTGQKQLGLPFFEKAAALEPHAEVYKGNLAHAYRWLQADASARSTYRQAIDLALQEADTGRSGRVLADLGLYYAALGDRNSSHVYFQQARTESPSDLDVLYKEAVAASLLGIPDRSFELLRKVCERGYPLAFAEHNPDLSALRSLAEFTALEQAAKDFHRGAD